jgi:geranylgeranyl diphosphate synthase type II
MLVRALLHTLDTPGDGHNDGPAVLNENARIVVLLLQASERLVLGQVEDVDLTGCPTLPQLGVVEHMHANKTASLIRAATEVGGVLGGASAEVVQALGAFGEALGLAFQILDDCIDVLDSAGEMGKTAGKDQRDRKVTHPAVAGIAASLSRVGELVAQAKAALGPHSSVTARSLLALANLIDQRAQERLARVTAPGSDDVRP